GGAVGRLDDVQLAAAIEDGGEQTGRVSRHVHHDADRRADVLRQFRDEVDECLHPAGRRADDNDTVLIQLRLLRLPPSNKARRGPPLHEVGGRIPAARMPTRKKTSRRNAAPKKSFVATPVDNALDQYVSSVFPIVAVGSSAGG